MPINPYSNYPFSYENYTGDNSTTTFSIPFSFTANTEIKAYVDGVEDTSLTFPSSNEVTLSATPATGALVQIRRVTDLTTRAVDFVSGSVLTEEDLDNANIQSFNIAQEATDRTIDSVSLDADDKMDAQSKIIKNVANPVNAQDAATKNYLENTWLTLADKAQLNSLNLANLNTVAAADSDINTVVANIIAIQGAAQNATDAETAKVAAEAVYDLFDDAYLGAYATDPTLDNDGNALADGALFFDTTSNVVKVYDLGTATWLRLTPTLVNQQNINTVAGISADIEALADIEDGTTATDAISTLAPVASDVSTLASVSADIQTLADIEDGTTATNAISTVATNVASVNNFADRYTVSATAPSSPNDGDLWFDTTSDIMKVYNATASSFQSANDAPSQLFDERNYTATASQTNFTVSYAVGFVDVFLNGVRLEPTSDFTATSGTEIVLTTGAALNDSIFVRGYQGFNVANTVPATGGTFTGDISAPNVVTSGTVFVPKLLSTVTIADGDNEIDFNSTYITDDYTHYKIITENIETNIFNNSTIPEVALQFGTADTPISTTTYYSNHSWIINRAFTSNQYNSIADFNAVNRMLVVNSTFVGITHGGNIEINLVNLRDSTLQSGYVLGSDSTYFNSYLDGFAIPLYSNGGYHHEGRTVLQGKSAKTNFVRILNTVASTSYKSGTIKLYGYNR